ncbi:MAG TPA: inositol monophosphatase family protein [Pseudonocardia sp.]|nr:inositol monophosphatase family protein [Pseudonocardia sp.]
MLSERESRYWLAVAEELALWAVDRIRGARPIAVDTKADPADLVTDVDREIERHVLDRLATVPGHRVRGEEYGTSPGEPGDLLWYVDAVDGTSNYAHDLGWSSFSLALADDAGLVVAAIGDPYRGEVTGAARGLGARRNGHPVHCSPAGTLAGQLVLTELSGHRPWPGMATLVEGLADRHATTRIMGSSALSVLAAGTGRAAATVLGHAGAVDVAAAVLIAREAGAVVRTPSGAEPAVPDGGPLLAAAPGVFAELTALYPR